MTNDLSPKLNIRSKLCGNAQFFGAFEQGDVLDVMLTVARREGASKVRFTMRSDRGVVFDLPFEFVMLDGAAEVYKLAVELDAVGLYWYDVAYDSENGAKYAARDEQLTVYAAGFSTPEWIKGGVMYQIFVDRFARGGDVPVRDDAVMIDDWYGAEPEYAEVRGGEVKNNTFFGGTLYGVVEKLDYIASLGVNCIYLNPIFEAYSNHKYDTGDYSKIDEMFGGEAAFDLLVTEAGERGIRVILDGVFNHTGADSVYFNKFGRYGNGGAYNDPRSPYHSWYNFRNYPDDYECWWNIKILPRVRCDDPSYRGYMLGEKGIVRDYIKRGASGWRLDVADELTPSFLDELRRAVKAEDPDALIIGEVWEDASNKIAYDVRRRYLQGGELDSVMNYPMRTAIIDFVTTGDAPAFAETAMGLYRNYPKCVSDVLMNFLGTHDTARIINVLGAKRPETDKNAVLAGSKLTDEQRAAAKHLLRAAWLICATIPGVPCIYYGDEAGMEGWDDPFCRRPYPWGREDADLLDFYRRICNFRRANAVYADGLFEIEHADGGVLIFSRGSGKQRVYTAVNVSDKAHSLDGAYTDALTGETLTHIPPKRARLIHK